MSVGWMAALVAYGVGFVVWLIRLGFRWDEIDWLDQGPMPVLGVAVWPLAVPVEVGRWLRRRAERRRLAAEEKRKWLEAPIP